MISLLPCPICGNTKLNINSCTYEDKTYGYNVYCPTCNFTGRTYVMKVKALNKWNSLVRQSASIKDKTPTNNYFG